MARARWALALAPLLAACTPRAAEPTPLPAARYEPLGPLPGATRVAFTVARGAFLDRPFPTELDRAGDGHLDLADFPGRGGGLLATYAELAERERDGFSIAQTVYFRIEGAISSLPRDPRATVSTSSPTFLMDVDAASPDRGKLVAIEARTHARATAYVPAGTLALKPLAGLVLRPGTLYAAVVRRSLGDAVGAPLGTTADFEAIKATSPRSTPTLERARLLFAPAFDVLASRGVARGDVAALAVFRTGRPHASTAKLVASLDRLPPQHAPRLLDAALERRPEGQSYVVLHGTYCTPSYQRDLGEAPFLDRGGELAPGESGTPEVVPIARGDAFGDPCAPLLRARFVLTLPARHDGGEVPLIVTAHGTGGDARTFLGERDFSGWAATVGAAVVSTDQPLHGARPGVGKPVAMPLGPLRIPIRGVRPEVFFYNPFRPAATIANMAQATADAGVLLRLFAGRDLAATDVFSNVAPSVLAKLSSSRVMVAGHSQGSQSLIALGAFDPRIRAVLLSGAGGDLRYGVLENKEFAAVRGFLEPLLGLEPGELDPFHPVLALVQLLADPADPQTYARAYREPAPGKGPTSVLHLEGLGDGYNPEPAAEALAAALGAVPLAPLLKPFPALDLLALRPSTTVRGNAGGGASTIAFVQLAPTHGEDGHFVMYEEPAAGRLVTAYFASVLAPSGGAPTIGPLR